MEWMWKKKVYLVLVLWLQVEDLHDVMQDISQELEKEAVIDK